MSLFDLWLYFVAIPAIGGLSAVAAFVIFVIGVVYAISNEGIDKKVHGRLAVIVFVLIIFAAIIPDKNQIVFLTGAYVTTNTEGVKELPENIVSAANNFLKDYTKKE